LGLGLCTVVFLVDFPVEMGVGRTLFVVMVILVKMVRQDGFSRDEFVMGFLVVLMGFCVHNRSSDFWVEFWVFGFLLGI
jgi:hypothetical protein